MVHFSGVQFNSNWCRFYGRWGWGALDQCMVLACVTVELHRRVLSRAQESSDSFHFLDMKMVLSKVLHEKRNNLLQVSYNTFPMRLQSHCPGIQRFSHLQTSVRPRGGWRGETWENLWVHTLSPLNVLIQWELALFKAPDSKSDSETSIMVSHWIGTFKGPNVCTQRFSCVQPLRLTLIREQGNLWFSGHNHSVNSNSQVKGWAEESLMWLLEPNLVFLIFGSKLHRIT